jgi:tol-pal system protein YbgF
MAEAGRKCGEQSQFGRTASYVTCRIVGITSERPFMTRSVHFALSAAVAVAGFVLGLLAVPTTGFAQMSESDMVVKLEQLEADMRRLTGAVEELQYRNQQLEQALRALQGGGAAGAAAPAARPGPAAVPAVPPAPPPGRRSDVFEPAQNPNAPGAPRVLGSPAAAAGGPITEPPAPIPGVADNQPGAPLDLGTMPANPNTPMAQPSLPPSQTPRDEFDLAYGYVLHKDYPLAQQAFQDFLKKHPSDPMASEAQFWLGESLFQSKNYQSAAEAFVTMTKKYPSSAKQPDTLLRLGQSLAALQQRDLACVTLAEVGKKFPRAAHNVKAAVEREQKRVHC